MNKYLVFASIGFELVGIMLATIYLGQAIDERYETRGLALAILMLLGLCGWLTHVILLVRRFQKSDQASDHQQ